MRRLHLLTAALALACNAQAQTLIDNANGYTLAAGGKLVRFQALAFDAAGRIVAVGDAKQVAAKAPGYQRIDVQGRTVLPGLIDAHGHVFGLGQVATAAELYSTTSLDGAVRRWPTTRAPTRSAPGWSATAGTRRSGSWAASPRRPSWMRRWRTARR